MKTISLTRKQLHDLVWAEPMMRLAKRYGVSDVALAKTCRKHDIPRPPRGYWVKKSVGKPTKKTPLPRPNDETTIRLQDPETVGISSPELNNEVKEKTAAESKPESKIEVAENLRAAHSLVSQARQEFEGAEKDEHGFLIPPRESPLHIRVSKASLRRALLIMDTLLKALDKRGHEVTSGPSVEILDVKLGFSITEQLETKKKQPEDHDLNGRYSFGHSRYDVVRVPSGRLELHIDADSYWGDGCRRTWRDTKKQTIENRLNQFVAGMYTLAAKKKEHEEVVRERERKRREEERRRQEEAEKRAEKRRQFEAEHERVNLLLRQASNWKQSQDLREFIEATKQRLLAENQHLEPGSELADWLIWADQQADRLDPLKPSPPSILDEPPPKEPEPRRSW